MASELACPDCGLQLLEVSAQGKLLGWTCQNCCPVFSTARVVGAFLDWIQNHRAKKRARRAARATTAPRKRLPAKRKDEKS